MKKLLILILSFWSLAALSQTRFNPSRGGVVQNAPANMAQYGPLDGRSYKYDSIHYTMRPYLDTSEVLRYLYLSKYRAGQFPIIVNTGGSLSNGVITGGTNVEWWFKNGLADSNLVVKASGSGGTTDLDSLRTDTNFKIVPTTGTAALIKSADSLTKAGAYPVTDRKKVQRNEFNISYAEMRALTSPATQVFYNTKINNIFGQFYWDATSTLTDDSVMVIKLASVTTGRLRRYIEGPINVKWFGAVGDGVTDDYAAIQKAVYFVIFNSYSPRELYFPVGTYAHTQPIVCAKFNSATHQYEQANILLSGQSVATNFSPILTTLYSVYKDKPNIIFQLCKGGGTDGLAFIGQYTTPYFPDSTYYDQTLTTYVDPTVRDAQYSPECAIAIDGFRYTGVPPDGGWPGMSIFYTQATGQPASGSGSTGLSFKHGQIYNHNIGFIFSPNGETQNAENIIVDDWFLTSTRIGIASTQSEEKNNIFTNMRGWSNMHTFVLNGRYGGLGQAAQITMDNIQLAGRVVQFIDWSIGGASPSFFKNIYFEQTGKFGNLNGGAGVGAHVQDFYFGFAAPADQGGRMQPYHISATSDVNFENGVARMYGTGLPVLVKGAPSFKYVSFEAVPNINADFTYQGLASPNFQDCFLSGYSTNTNNYVGYTKPIVGSPTSFNKTSDYGDFSITSPTNELSGFAKTYSINGTKIRKITTPESAKSITVSIPSTGVRRFTFTPTVRGQFQISQPVIFYDYPSGQSAFAGYVSDTSGNLITVSNVPNSISSGTYTPMLSMPSTLYSFMGNTTSGSPLITGYRTNDLGISVGQQIYSTTIGGFSVVKKISNDTVTISTNAAYTASREVFQSSAAKMIFKTFSVGNVASGTVPGTTIFAVGDEIWDGGTQRQIKYVCKSPGYFSTDSTSYARFAVNDSLLVYDVPDGDSTLKMPSTGWVKRNTGAGGTIADATTSTKGKMQVGNWLQVTSGLVNVDSSKMLPLKLYANKTVDLNGNLLTFNNGSPTRFDFLDMYNASNRTDLLFKPYGDASYKMGLGGTAAGSFVLAGNHPYYLGNNGSTPGFFESFYLLGGGVDPIRMFTSDAAGTVYQPYGISDIGVFKFLINPRFSALTSSGDTTTYKPMGVDGSGNPIRMSSWPGSGGGYTIQQIKDSLNLDTTYHSRTFQSTTATTFNVDTIYFTGAVNEVLRITCEMQSGKSGTGSYQSTKTMFYNITSGGTITDGTGDIDRSDQYIPTGGLSTYTFSITRTGALIFIQCVSESGTINGKISYQVQRLKSY